LISKAALLSGVWVPIPTFCEYAPEHISMMDKVVNNLFIFSYLNKNI
jgi:hypothetical protein